MNHFKQLFLLITLSLFAQFLVAQSNQLYMTVTPAQYPDTTNKPAIVTESVKKSSAPKQDVYYESRTVTPESKLSIGNASAVITTEKKNPASAAKEKTTVNYSEQKIKKSEVPKEAAVVPK
jgi:hypothetical protein